MTDYFGLDVGFQDEHALFASLMDSCRRIPGPDEQVKPRFWEMRRLLLDSRRYTLDSDLLPQVGDMCELTRSIFTSAHNGPWVCCGLQGHPAAGKVVLLDPSGTTVSIMTSAAPYCITVVSRVSDALC